MAVLPQNILSIYHDTQAAVMLLTRVAVIWPDDAPPPNTARCYWAFPLVGIGISAPTALIGAVLVMVGVPALAAAAFILLSLMVITGGLHHDGLADLADSLGGKDKERRLAIMHDSTTGSFGNLGLITTTIINTACLAEIGAVDPFFMVTAITVTSALSRSMMALQRWHHPTPTDHGFASQTGKPSTQVMSLALMLGLLTGLVLTSTLLAFISMAAGLIVTYLLGQFLLRWIGGVNGDGLGATQQLSEMAALMAFTLAI
jgi:adenosylcobinamide-GDP ribazoletransferase